MTIVVHHTSRNLAVLIIVVIVHVAVILTLPRMQSTQVNDLRQFQSTWVVIESHMPDRDRLSAQSKRRLNVQQRSNLQEHALPVIQSSPITLKEPSRLDWHAESERVANDIATRRSKRAELTPKLLEADPNPIVRAPKHRRGDTEHLDDSELITWIDDRCYATNRNRATPQLDENRVVIECKGSMGKPLPRSDMFDHFRPRYLRDP